MVGPAARPGAPAARRLCAEYRLSVVDVGGGPSTEPAAPQPRSHPVLEPDTDSPVAALSRRQHEVMALVSRGVRNSEIAARLHVSEKTVKNHINRIFRSLGAGSRVEAVLIWQRHQQSRRHQHNQQDQHSGAIRRDAPNPPPAPALDRHPGHGGNP